MSHPHPSLTGVPLAHVVASLIIAFLASAQPVAAQVLGGERPGRATAEHGHALHVSHPLVTESPLPDMKVRLDYFSRALDVAGVKGREQVARLEGEYPFRPWFSLEANVPFVWRDIGGENEASIGTTELAVKLATFALAEWGVLLGGGVEFGLPTGSDRKDIGSNHLVEVEPYVDIAYLHRRLELVAFATFSTTARRRAGEPAERELGVNGSALYHATSRLEVLLEFDGSRALAGDEEGEQTVHVAPGVKVRPFRTPQTVLGVSVRWPVSDHREFERQLLMSALYHF